MDTQLALNIMPHTLPENAHNFDESLHPYGPWKHYEWDNMDNSRYVVILHKPWHVIEANMTECFGNLHAHVTRDSRDCDGSYENDYVAVAADCNFNASREYVNLVKTGEMYQHDWNAYQPCTTEAEFRYTMLDLDEWDSEDADAHYRFVQISSNPDEFDRHRATDEGYESENVVFCYDWSCDVMSRRFRDHTAESMGY